MSWLLSCYYYTIIKGLSQEILIHKVGYISTFKNARKPLRWGAEPTFRLWNLRLNDLLGLQQTPDQIIADVRSGKVSIEPIGSDYTQQSNFGEMVMDQHYRLDDYPSTAVLKY